MAKGLAVLESFDTERQKLNATLAAGKAGITRASARRHLLTLVHLGYLETDGSHFWLAPKILRFSGSYLASARLPRLLQPMLNRVAQQVRCPVSAVVLDGDEVVIVARGGPVGVLAYGVHLGARLPAFATSTGRMLLASMARSELVRWTRKRVLPRLTPKTTTDAKVLCTMIAQAADQDWCIASEEHELGVHALAVPLRDMQGRTVAALNVVVTSPARAALVTLNEMLPILQDGAREVRPLL